MTEKIDYKQVGLMCGIEIHQQLDTNKLFCNCKSKIITDKKPDAEITRELKASAGETGELDKAALHEQQKEKKYVYQVFNEACCLVELDEEPPHDMNKEALELVLQVSKILDAKIVDQVQIMRKTVVDGSNTSGFQRTSFVAGCGVLETTEGKIGIPTICIEEDAAQIVERHPDHDIYNLSRLGIPLIEIATDPDIKTPEQCREAAEKIGMILRSTGKVKRGIGTIRQDINISIKGGVRVELKGVQDLRGIIKIVENEVERQLFFKETYKTPKTSAIHDVTQILHKTESKVLRKSLDNKGVILGMKIDGFNGKLKEHINPGKRLGAELSDYAKSKTKVGGLFHTDELPNYGITQHEVDMIKKELHLHENDAFIIIADNKEVAHKALEAVKERLENPLTKEVRKANPDFTTSYMRPMPGAARMYPETDVKPITPDVKNIKLPELINDKIKRYETDYKISKDLATQAAKTGLNLDVYIKNYSNLKPSFIADTLINAPREIKTRHAKEIEIEEIIDEVLEKANDEKIPISAVFEILTEIALGVKPNYDKYKTMNDAEAEHIIKKIIIENAKLTPGALMGLIMKELRGKIDGKKVQELIKKNIPHP